MRDNPNKPTDDRYLVLKPPCAYCRHLTFAGTQESLRGWTCSAFPEEIPYGILTRATDHKVEYIVQVGSDVYESKVYQFDDGPHVVTFGGEWRPVG